MIDLTLIVCIAVVGGAIIYKKYIYSLMETAPAIGMSMFLAYCALCGFYRYKKVFGGVIDGVY